MLTDSNIRRLTAINSIESLLEFLREDLKWEIDDPDPDVAANEFTPEELGLKEEHIPKINAIYQIRPVTSQQPWGIFFIDFENKKLPVTIMRRILNQLVIKKRSTSSVGKGWDTGDLLFMTTYGESGSPDVAFAHFHTQEGDLPTLRVMEWHKEDNQAKLKSTYDALKSGLGWPPDTNNQEAWREQWKTPFKHKVGHTIKTAKVLAEKLAELSKNIKEACLQQLDAETEKGQVTKLYHAFKEALVHDLKPEDFADTFAQTITYGLFSAAVSRRAPEDKGSKSLTTETMAQLVPETSPFLKEVLETFLDVGGRKGGVDFDLLGVQDVVELLRSDETDMQAILADFGSKREDHDPVIHFYEDYLAAFNKKKKVERGVFYTPQPVVSYIVRSVHELLRTEFGLEDGLASTTTWGEMAEKNSEIEIPQDTDKDDPFVVILDPATGTATFLVEVIDVIWDHLRLKWKTDPEACISMVRNLARNTNRIDSFDSFWNAYVPDHLLPRLFGYELMMAPYAIAHMKVGLKLSETGYKFGGNQRVWICLTNALEPATELQGRLAIEWQALAHESQAVSAVKSTTRFTVIIGNPPYSKLSSNNNDWIFNLMKRFKTSVSNEEIQLQALSNDYVKFFALYTHIQEQSHIGVLGVVTDNSYLDGPLFRDMRNYLINNSSRLQILDLGGNSRKGGSNATDENIFDGIQQGIAVNIQFHHQKRRYPHLYLRVFGTIHEKQNILAKKNANPFQIIDPRPPLAILVPRSGLVEDEWSQWISLPDIFAGGIRRGRPLSFNGAALTTRHDDFAISFSHDDLVKNLTGFFNTNFSKRDITEKFSLCQSSHFSFEEARESLTLPKAVATIQTILYRPFDFRFVPYHKSLLGEPRTEIMKPLLEGSLGLLSTRRVTGKAWDNVFVCRGLVEYKAATHDRNTQVFPLYLSKNRRDSQQILNNIEDQIAVPNLDCKILKDFQNAEAVFYFIYSVLHSEVYRRRYSEQLQTDYPRIPILAQSGAKNKLISLGQALVDTHLFTSDVFRNLPSTYIGSESPQVDKVIYLDEVVWLNGKGSKRSPQSGSSGFFGVPSAVWNFHIGGYQVCEKWLKDRGPKRGKPGRILTQEDIEHYQKIVAAISETIRIMKEIDEVIEQHGGWPGAFQTNEAT